MGQGLPHSWEKVEENKVRTAKVGDKILKYKHNDGTVVSVIADEVIPHQAGFVYAVHKDGREEGCGYEHKARARGKAMSLMHAHNYD